MAQLVVPTGTFSRKRDVDVNRLLTSRSHRKRKASPKIPNDLGEKARKVRKYSIQGRMAQLVEHIVHIDGVTGSSPVATTTSPWKYCISEGFLYVLSAPSSPPRQGEGQSDRI